MARGQSYPTPRLRSGADGVSSSETPLPAAATVIEAAAPMAKADVLDGPLPAAPSAPEVDADEATRVDAEPMHPHGGGTARGLCLSRPCPRGSSRWPCSGGGAEFHNGSVQSNSASEPRPLRARCRSRHRATAPEHGVRGPFLTLEDETGNINVVVWTSILERFRGPILGGRLLLVKGVLEREGSVIHVVAGHVSDHSGRIGELRARSRDFH